MSMDIPRSFDHSESKIVKLKVHEREHLVRTEVQGAANIAFGAVGAKIPERVQTIN